jgi:hypothetical protein
MKISLSLPNVANEIAARVAARWPELARDPIPGVWFTGSNVWELLYPELSDRRPPLGRDWDIFTIGEDAAHQVAARLGLARYPACRTKDKRHGAPMTIDPAHVPNLVVLPMDCVDPDTGPSYGEGYCYATERGEVDLWISTPGDVLGELRTYPAGSHAHCRAAFSFTDGLVVLPNELAVVAREPAQREEMAS